MSIVRIALFAVILAVCAYIYVVWSEIWVPGSHPNVPVIALFLALAWVANRATKRR